MRSRIRPSFRQPGREAFSLTELLVVIAVIAILAAILLPVVASVRRSAQDARCRSNLRVIHNGLLLYANDNRDLLPINDTSNGGDNGNQWHVSGSRTSGNAFGKVLGGGYLGAIPATGTQTYLAYWFCPTATYRDDSHNVSLASGSFIATSYQYRLGGAFQGLPPPVLRFSDAARLALVADGFNERYRSHEEAGRTAVYGDGAVRFVRFTEDFPASRKTNNGAYRSNLPHWTEWLDAGRDGN
jgi:prepilin-type N-terminal cleavage/methylation domain-containing protein